MTFSLLNLYKRSFVSYCLLNLLLGKLCFYRPKLITSFARSVSSMTLMVGRQEGRPACNIISHLYSPNVYTWKA